MTLHMPSLCISRNGSEQPDIKAREKECSKVHRASRFINEVNYCKHFTNSEFAIGQSVSTVCLRVYAIHTRFEFSYSPLRVTK